MKRWILLLAVLVLGGCHSSSVRNEDCLSLRNPAETGGRCEGVFTSSNKKYHVYPVKDIFGYAQVNPWVGEWKTTTSPSKLDVRVNPDNESVSFIGADLPKDGTMAWLPLPEEMKVDFNPKIFRGPFPKPLTEPDKNFFRTDVPGQSEGKGLRFHFATSQQDLPVEVIITGKTMDVDQAFEAKALITLKSGEQAVTIPWENFHLTSQVIADHESMKTDYKLVPVPKQDRIGVLFPAGASIVASAFPIIAIGLRVHAKNYSLTLNGPIHRDLDLSWVLQDPEAFTRAEVLTRVLGPDASGIVQMVAKKLNSTEAQNYALDIIAKGHDAIEAELKKYQYKMLEFSGKVSVEEFFGHFDVIGQNPPVPIEAPPFAYLHGRYTHAAQMLTLLHNSTREEQRDLYRLMQLSGKPGKTWHNIWNVFFDAPGTDGPNQPQWWVLKFRERNILAEPAAQPL